MGFTASFCQTSVVRVLFPPSLRSSFICHFRLSHPSDVETRRDRGGLDLGWRFLVRAFHVPVSRCGLALGSLELHQCLDLRDWRRYPIRLPGMLIIVVVVVIVLVDVVT